MMKRTHSVLWLLSLFTQYDTVVVHAWSFDSPAKAAFRTQDLRIANHARISTVLCNHNDDSSEGAYNDDDNEDNNKDWSTWSVTDDWSALSEANHPAVESRDIFHQDILQRAAQRLMAQQQQGHQQKDVGDDSTSQDVWLHESIHKILNPDDDDDDSKDGTITADDQEGNQVALLVRCQDVPQEFLIAQGRAVADLTWEQAHHVRQLVRWDGSTEQWRPTEFFQQSMAQVFDQHAVLLTNLDPEEEQDDDDDDDDSESSSSSSSLVWDASAVAAWMRQSLQEPCGKHDPRVLTVLSRFGTKGYLTHAQNLQDLYLEALVGTTPTIANNISNDSKKKETDDQSAVVVEERECQRLMERRQDALSAVWRDLKRHGIVSPYQQEHAEQLRQMELQQPTVLNHNNNNKMTSSTMMFMDECEILYDSIAEGWYKDSQGQWQRHGKSSHEKVLLAADQRTPLLLQDGDYVYIDEESCIGCTQCALAAPASFRMLDNGRARTFLQRGRIPDVEAAVKTCPVNCMHYVDFDRLTTLELARDSHDGDDGREDHRHFGRDRRNNKWRAHTPLYVSRMESSDANHKDSLYHYTRRQCYQSSQCPSKGCYDCPLHASNPEANPHLQKRRKEAIHARAETFQENGTADSYRKTADL